MGYNDSNARRLVFDIETCPLADAGDYLEPAEAPANYKDPEKIAAYIAEKQAENLTRCGLDPDLCRIVAIGDWLEGEPEISADVCRGGDVDEGSLIAAFWSRAEDKHLVGFNCLAFDLPVLLRRSLYLGIKAPMITIDRFRHPQVTDLMQALSFNGALKFRGLQFYARRFGLRARTSDALDGRGDLIAAAVALEQWNEVDSHVRADVDLTAQLAAKMGLWSATL